jgi:hypothetical protein
MSIIVELPDGKEVEFPDNTPKETMQNALKSYSNKNQPSNDTVNLGGVNPILSGLEATGRGILQASGKIGSKALQFGAGLVRPDLKEEINKIDPQEILAKQEEEAQNKEKDKGLLYRGTKGLTKVLPYMAGNGLLATVAGGAISSGLEAKKENINSIDRLKEAGIGGVASGLTYGALKGSGIVAKSAKKGVQGLFNVNPKAVKEFAEAGITPTVADVSESNTVKSIQKFLEKTPGASGKIENTRKAVVSQIEDKLGKIAVYPEVSKQQAGEVIQEGAERYVNRFKNTSSKLYNKLDKFVGKDELIDISNTSNLLKNQIDEFAKTPELANIINNSEGGNILNKIIKDADTYEGKIPYQAIKKYRSLIGASIGDKFKIGDADRQLLKNVYATLSDDMKTAFATKGDDALLSFNKANEFYKAGAEKIESQLSKVINSKVPEDVYKNAISGTKLGGTKINSLMKGLEPKEKDIVRSQVIKQLGYKDAEGTFNPAKFFTEYNKISTEAKNAIFNSEQKTSLNGLMRVISRLKDVDARANFSNTASHALLPMLSVGAWFQPVGIASAIGTANVSARLLTSPKFINWLTTGTKLTSTSAFEKHLGKLAVMAGQNDDLKEDIYNYITSLNKGEQE